MKNFLLKHYRLIFLYLFIITFIGGSFMLEFTLFDIHLYAYRAFLMIILPVFFFSGKLLLYNNKVSKYAFFFLIIWLLYALLSILWVIDRTMAWKDILYILFGIATFVFLVSIKDGYKAFKQDFTHCWTRVFFVVLLVSVWEMYTAKHLISSFTVALHQLGPFHQLNNVPVFTFDNPNHFAIYACLSAIIFIMAILHKKNIILNTFLIFLNLFLVYILSSRFGIITFIFIGLITLIVFFQNQNKEKVQKAVLSLSRFLVMAFFLVISIFGFHKIERVHGELADSLVASNPNKKTKLMDSLSITHYETPFNKISIDERLSSNVLRRNLILDGIYFFKESNGLGVGAGNFKSYIRAGKGHYQTDGIDSPHNWVIEIISQYGAVIIILFLILFVYLIVVIYRSVKKNGFNNNHLELIFLITCYLIISNANSIFISLPLNWIMFSLIVLFTDDLLPSKERRI